MKSLIISASVLTAFIGLSSCESHDWDKTKKLYQKHGDEAEHGQDDQAEKSEEEKH